MASALQRVKAFFTPASARVNAEIGAQNVDMSRRVVGARALGGATVKVKYAAGQMAGFMDPNEMNDPRFLYGDGKTRPGRLGQIRAADPVMAPAMDERADLLRSLDFDVVPSVDTDEGRAAALAVGDLMRNMADRTLGSWVADTCDAMFTYGFDLQEIVISDGRLALAPIAAGAVREWEQDPNAAGLMWSRVRVDSYTSYVWLPVEKAAYFRMTTAPGVYYGRSGLRSYVAPYTVEEAATTAGLHAIAMSTGVPYAHRTNNGMDSADDDAAILTVLESLRDGQPQPSILSAAVDFKWLASPGTSLQQIPPFLKLLDERKRAAALQAINSLGVHGTGSNALGKTVAEEDQRKLRRLLDGQMDILSGVNASAGTLMRTLTAWCGYSEHVAPRIVIAWTEEDQRRSVEHIAAVAQIMRDGLLAPTPERLAALARMAGLPVEEVAGA